MKRAGKLRLVFYLNILALGLLAGYKFYLVFIDQKPAALHTRQIEHIEEILENKEDFSFAVVGNINNSIGIFERKIVPMLNRSGVDFVVSAGNAVSSGGEDKYRALFGSLDRLNMPYLLTFGENEIGRFGGYHFYNHFGPYFYSFSAGDSRFIFLDSTGKTSYAWQVRWLEEQLELAPEFNTFLFVGNAVRPVDSEGLFGADDYLLPDPVRKQLATLIEESGVDAVFSANLPRYAQVRSADTDYVVTGGAGGFVLNTEKSYYHYVRVSVTDLGVAIQPVRLEIGQHPVFRTLESLWLFTHSLVYVGYLNFLWLLCGLIAMSVWLYSAIFTERNYYPDYDVDPDLYLGKPLRIAMFTNNYLPFIGGVPISIDRLRKGLKALQHQVLIVAPSYLGTSSSAASEDVLRLPSLLHLGRKKEFPITNVMSLSLFRAMSSFRPDIIHLHHPIWLGSVGLMFAKRKRVPVIYTYHTRLEHYSHYVPLPGALFRNLISHALVRRFANRCDGVVVPTEAAEEYLRMIGVKTTLFVLPTGIEFEKFAHVEPDAVASLKAQLGIGDEQVLISVSRLSQEKNIDFMLDSLQALAQRPGLRFKLLIIGEGSHREHIEAKVERLGLEGKVLLLGAVEPALMPLYYKLGDVFVFASRSETQGMVILEAMAAGLPVVAVRSSGIDELVQDGVNGYKTLLNQTLWRDRVEQLLTDRPLRAKLAVQAQSFAEGHRVESFAGQMARIYAYVLSARQRALASAEPGQDRAT